MVNLSCVLLLLAEQQWQSVSVWGKKPVLILGNYFISRPLEYVKLSKKSCFDWRYPTSSSHHMRMTQHYNSHDDCFFVRHCCAKWILLLWLIIDLCDVLSRLSPPFLHLESEVRILAFADIFVFLLSPYQPDRALRRLQTTCQTFCA